MISVAKHLRIVRSNVGDDEVEKRAGAVSALATAFNKIKDVATLLRIGNDLAEGLAGSEMTAAFADQVEAAIQKSSKSFLRAEQPLETAVIGAMAVHEALAGSPGSSMTWQIRDVIAAGAWLALSYVPPFAERKLEDLRTELVTRASAWTIGAAESSRTRLMIPDLVSPTAAEAVPDRVAADLKKAMDAIEKLRSNAAVDREETDLLWWAMGGRSRILDRPLASLSPPARAVVAGVEVSAMLRRLPGQAHREIALKDVPVHGSLDLAGLMAELGADRDLLEARTVISGVSSLPHVFPLINALGGTVAEDEAARIARPVEDWAGRALMEAAVTRMWAGGNGKL